MNPWTDPSPPARAGHPRRAVAAALATLVVASGPLASAAPSRSAASIVDGLVRAARALKFPVRRQAEGRWQISHARGLVFVGATDDGGALVAWMRDGSHAGVVEDWNRAETRTAAFPYEDGRSILRMTLLKSRYDDGDLRALLRAFWADVERFDAELREALGVVEPLPAGATRGPVECDFSRSDGPAVFAPIEVDSVVYPIASEPLEGESPAPAPAFVGRRQRVASLSGFDAHGCPVVRLAGVPGTWRARDLMLLPVPGEAPPQPRVVAFVTMRDRASRDLLEYLDGEGVDVKRVDLGGGHAEMAELRAEAERLRVPHAALQPLPVLVVGDRFVVGADRSNVGALFDPE